jgi:threonine synthase
MSLFSPSLEGFECSHCAARFEPRAPLGLCPLCGSPLLCRYDLARVRREVPRARLGERGTDLWRYRDVLPFRGEDAVRLGEGGTPFLPLPQFGSELEIAEIWLKDESFNPTLSFKARGLCMAVNGALAWGLDSVALPSAGNAGSAAAAYAAAAGLECSVFVPRDTPDVFTLEQRALGAEVCLVDGTIADAGRALAGSALAETSWNVATFREPFRVEGKKTLGYEIVEQSGWRFPDIILYPTGGGTGLVGMWKAFAELLELGWCEPPLPKLVAVQPEGCAPIVRAFEEGLERAPAWPDARTCALGLRVPSPFADALILRSLKASGGAAVAVSEEEILDGISDLSRRAGCLACPEGGATLAALRRLRTQGVVREASRVVLFNTGSGLKYPDALQAAQARRAEARS